MGSFGKMILGFLVIVIGVILFFIGAVITSTGFIFAPWGELTSGITQSIYLFGGIFMISGMFVGILGIYLIYTGSKQEMKEVLGTGTRVLRMCPKCGRNLEQKVRFCPDCGKELG